MKTKLIILALLIAVGAAARAQVEPSAVTGPAHLQYVFRYSESAYVGSTYGDRQTISPSGSISYLNGEERHPFTLKYSGGYTWSIAGPGYATGLFQRMTLAQELIWRHWGMSVADNVDRRELASAPAANVIELNFRGGNASRGSLHNAF